MKVPKNYPISKDVIDRRHGEKPSTREKIRDLYIDVRNDWRESRRLSKNRGKKYMRSTRDVTGREKIMPKEKFLQSAIKHPGALKEAARKNGRSTKEEAEVESKSPNKRIRSRGELGKRLLGIAKHGNIKRGKPKSRKRGYTKRG
jgi:hypothetical protein